MGADIGWLRVIEERGLLAETAGLCGGDLRTPPPARTRAAAPPPPPAEWAVEFVVPWAPRNESNIGGGLRAKLARKAAAKSATDAAIPPVLSLLPLPVLVTLTRVGGLKRMDDDGLGTALKWVRDRVAAALGVDDGDTAKVRFRTRQRPGWGRARVLVRVETAPG